LANKISSIESTITDLGEGKAFALHNILELDGRVSAYPKSTRGFSSMNCYLLREDNAAVLLDTGFNGQIDFLSEQISSLITKDTPLSLYPLRQNEFMSVGNIVALANRFNVVEAFSNRPNIDFWFDFELEDFIPKEEKDKKFTTSKLGNELKINIGENPERLIHGLVAPIRLISTMWIFDHGTKTLFSSDMFSHISQKRLDGPWISDKDELTTTSFVRSFLLNTRYWWLEGVDTGPLREGITEVFNKFDIHTIAPGYGTILTGKEQVEKQFNILDEVLRDLDSSVVKASYVPRNLER
jgi:flavorubredoxin